MNEKLWALVQEFVNKSQVGNAELAVAGANLDPDVTSVFTKHMYELAETNNHPIQWV
ncbi:hypothetical protein NIE88_08655 [Sporolactobacillus shoreicorticis]|uniref:Uncharacterized protein n=1 Tax=Sporolactobacillus shoreicorticis TaxID=1923877 RepID=A0ABW5S297_9BACL|nr:hypothetical protein [Sporolactobacillus shoreicorticis]MCO7125840.1 hypothetical protein [Sporolactobacillus shoreicorticis]